MGKPFNSHRVLSALAGLAVVVGFAAGCGSSNKEDAGLTNCGQNGTESCSTSLEVTGGTYYRTYTNSGGGPTGEDAGEDAGTGEADPASVSTFRLDKYVVTVGRFRPFVNAWNDGWLPPVGSGKHTYLNGGQGLVNVGDDAGITYETGWVASDDGNLAPTTSNLTTTSFSSIVPTTACAFFAPTWTASAGSNENLPITCVNWYEAYAFCIWDGGFLPSEAEWEYAAAGGSQQREYPWGSTDPGTANQYAIYGCYYPNGLDGCTATVANIAPVGTATLGAGRWGQLDLAGEVYQWNLDWYAVNYVDPCMDGAYLTATSYGRVTRGGGLNANAKWPFLPTARGSMFPAGRQGYGVRCARVP